MNNLIGYISIVIGLMLFLAALFTLRGLQYKKGSNSRNKSMLAAQMAFVTAVAGGVLLVVPIMSNLLPSVENVDVYYYFDNELGDTIVAPKKNVIIRKNRYIISINGSVYNLPEENVTYYKTTIN